MIEQHALYEIEPREYNICTVAIGHDPEGRWAKFFPKVAPVLNQVFDRVIFSFTESTSKETIRAARKGGWQIIVQEDPSIGKNRLAALRLGLESGCQFINLWDGDRLIHAAIVDQLELRDFVANIPRYDFLIGGATQESIDTHQKSMTSWEQVKSWALGYYLEIEGDIMNRGCVAFSRDLAKFIVQYPEVGDDNTGIWPILALAFYKSRQAGRVEDTGRLPVGYREYSQMLGFEDWLFDGATREESARRKSTHQDFMRRAEDVIRIITAAQKVAQDFDLKLWEGESFEDLIRRLGK